MTTAAPQWTTTPDERTLAMIANLLSAFTGFIGPMIIFFIKKDSVFVRLHALQALLWHLGYMVLMFGGMIIVFITIFASVIGHRTGPNGPPPAFFVFFPFIWGTFMIGWLLNMTLGIIGTVKANEGRWWRYPLVGRLAERFLNVDLNAVPPLPPYPIGPPAP